MFKQIPSRARLLRRRPLFNRPHLTLCRCFQIVFTLMATLLGKDGLAASVAGSPRTSRIARTLPEELKIASRPAYVSECVQREAVAESLRVLNTVRSRPRSRSRRSGFSSMDSRNSSSPIRSSDGFGVPAGLPSAAIWRLRQVSSALGAVV